MPPRRVNAAKVRAPRHAVCAVRKEGVPGAAWSQEGLWWLVVCDAGDQWRHFHICCSSLLYDVWNKGNFLVCGLFNTNVPQDIIYTPWEKSGRREEKFWGQIRLPLFNFYSMGMSTLKALRRHGVNTQLMRTLRTIRPRSSFLYFHPSMLTTVMTWAFTSCGPTVCHEFYVLSTEDSPRPHEKPVRSTLHRRHLQFTREETSFEGLGSRRKATPLRSRKNWIRKGRLQPLCSAAAPSSAERCAGPVPLLPRKVTVFFLALRTHSSEWLLLCGWLELRRLVSTSLSCAVVISLSLSSAFWKCSILCLCFLIEVIGTGLPASQVIVRSKQRPGVKNLFFF